MRVGQYFGAGGPGEAGTMLKKLNGFVEALKDGSQIKKFRVVGYCWGAKVRIFNSALHVCAQGASEARSTV